MIIAHLRSPPLLFCCTRRQLAVYIGLMTVGILSLFLARHRDLVVLKTRVEPFELLMGAPESSEIIVKKPTILKREVAASSADLRLLTLLMAGSKTPARTLSRTSPSIRSRP
jgi:hypothetical protein